MNAEQLQPSLPPSSFSFQVLDFPHPVAGRVPRQAVIKTSHHESSSSLRYSLHFSPTLRPCDLRTFRLLLPGMGKRGARFISERFLLEDPSAKTNDLDTPPDRVWFYP